MLAIASGFVVVPDHLNPWAPLRIEQPPNFLTGYKIGRLRRDRELCLSVLAAERCHRPVAFAGAAPGCSLQDAVQVPARSISYGGDLVLSCPMGVALALFERHVVQPAAQAHLAQPVVGIRHFGSYACRNVYGRRTGRISQHATANALDVAAFRLRDGRSISLSGDWAGEGAGGNFLRDVRAGACGIFRTVLGPDYNPAHRDHFHLDMGGYSFCR